MRESILPCQPGRRFTLYCSSDMHEGKSWGGRRAMKGFWEKLFGSRSSSPPAPPANDGEDDVLSEVRAQIRRDLIAGFDDTKTIIQSAVEVFESDVEPSILENHARHCFDEELAAHTARQSTWPKTTDCDRLDAAFVALEKSGVISRQHFSCCGNCGST